MGTVANVRAEPQPLAVLVSGAPGSGKSTVGLGCATWEVDTTDGCEPQVDEIAAEITRTFCPTRRI